MVEAIDEAFARWELDRNPAAPFNLASAFNQLTMGVIVKTLFGTGLSTTEMNRVSEAMGFALDYFITGMLVTALPDWIPMPGKARFHESLATFDEAVYRIVAECRERQESGHHLLAMLLDTVDEETGEGMTDKQLRDEVATLFLAGYETTSIALSWATEYLTLNPATMQKLQAEVDAVLGGRRPTFADLPNLPYSRMVLPSAHGHRR
jgi:cytochrome P450